MAKGKYEYWLTEDGLTLLEGWARDGLTDEQIAHNTGITATTLYAWKNKYPEISESLKKGKEVIDRQVENALLKRALGFEYEEVTKERIVDTGQAQRHGGESELTEKQWEMAKSYFGHSCAYCGGSGNLTKDHLDPLANGGELTISNIIPACQSCNSSKKDKQWLSWFQSQKFYDPQKAEKIVAYVDFALDFSQIDKPNTGNLVVTKVVTKMVVPDTTAQIFWLKNRKPNDYRDKRDVEHSGGVNIKNQYESMSDEELNETAKHFAEILSD